MKQRTKRVFALLMALVMALSFAGVLGACGDLVGKDKDTDKEDPCANGHTIVAVAEKPATETEAGYEAYWKCSVCNKMFSDKDGKTQISKPVEIPKLTSTVDPDKGLTQDDPLTPEEAIILMDQAGSGKVVNAANKVQYYVQGVVNEGSTVDTQYNEWTFKLAAGSKTLSCKAKIDNSVTNKPTETDGALDGSTIIIKGFLELYNGWYQCSYLPASASPTGSKFTPSIVSITTEVAQVASISLDHTEDMVLLASHANKYMSVKATVQPANAPQDVTWSVSANTANIAVSDNGRITWTETEGEATVTATATGTDKSASVKVKVQNVNGATQDDPLTVDEALALMTEDGEVFAGYAADKAQGFYLTGKVENSQFSSRTSSTYWTFDMAGTDSKKIACTCTSFSGVGFGDGQLDGYTVVMRNVTLKKTGTTYTAGNTSNFAYAVSATPPAITAITIDETATVNMPLQAQIKIQSIQPANVKLDGTEVWHTSDESKATVEGGMVTGVSAGTVQVWVSVGSVESNKCSVTVNAAASANKFTLDWTKDFSTDTVCDGTTVFISTPSTEKLLDETINKWTPGQTEITAISIEGKVNTAVSENVFGFGFYPGKKAASGTLSVTTQHQIKKITIKYIAYATGTQVEFTVNGQKHHQDKIDNKWDGKVASAIEAEIELSEAANKITIESLNDKTSQFAIVGITFEW